MYVYDTKEGILRSSVRIKGLDEIRVDWFSLSDEVKRFPKFDGKTIVLDSKAKAKAEKLATLNLSQSLISERDSILIKTDWTQLEDAPLTDEQKQAAASYRQELRDLPDNTKDPARPEWPTPPDFLL